MAACRPKDILDADLVKAIEKAEASDGVRYGAGFLDGEQVFVDVTFYPKRKWWLYRGDVRTEASIADAQRVRKLSL